MNIVVTGASRGIGLAILEKFGEEGWNLGFCSLHEDSVIKTRDKLTQKFPHSKVYAAVCDMSKKEDVLCFAKNCLLEFEGIDVLVNNAGIFLQGNLSSPLYEDGLETLLQLNVLSAYWMGKEIIPSMIAQQHGHIFNISSIAGLKEYDHGGSYTVSKFALTGYTKQLRHELKSKKIRVTGVYPGAVLTDSWSGTELPRERFINVNDVAEMIYATTQLSKSAVVEDIVIRPQEGDI